jgi:LysM repeat protein
MVGALVALVGIDGGGDGRMEGVRSRSTRPETGPTKTTTSTTTRPPINYTVKRGDTLTALARFFGVYTSAIIEANENLDPDHLVEGQSLVIPPPLPVELVVNPRNVPVGGSVRLKLNGAKELENVIFEIVRPTGPFIGSPHEASSKGVVTTTYELGLADPPGTYTVIARGDQGTTVQASFRVEAAGR